MEDTYKLTLVDSDIRRRAMIFHALSSNHIHVEPLESIADVTLIWPTSGIILAYDDSNSIVELTRQMSQDNVWLPILAFHEKAQAAQIVQAVLDGAIEYLTWPFDAAGLAASLERAKSRVNYPGSVKMRETIAKVRIKKLTSREREVLDGVTDGLSNRLIAEWLSISPRTVEVHRARMLNKLGASHISDAIRIALEANLTSWRGPPIWRSRQSEAS